MVNIVETNKVVAIDETVKGVVIKVTVLAVVTAGTAFNTTPARHARGEAG